MNTINSFHIGLKKFMVRFNGVVSKYLDNYVNTLENLKIKLTHSTNYYNFKDIKSCRY